MRLNERFDSRTAFIDMLLAGQMNLFVLLVVALAMVNPVAKQVNGMEMKAEMIITAKWESGADCDVDMWVKGPTGSISWYNQKDIDGMHLDRDDTGNINDKVTIGGKEITNPLNEEYWVLRARVPGIYIVNYYLYECRGDARKALVDQGIPVGVNVTLQKMNPTLQTVKVTDVQFVKPYEEIHAFRFELDALADVKRVWFEPADIVTSKNSGGNGYNMYGGPGGGN